MDISRNNGTVVDFDYFVRVTFNTEKQSRNEIETSRVHQQKTLLNCWIVGGQQNADQICVGRLKNEMHFTDHNIVIVLHNVI